VGVRDNGGLTRKKEKSRALKNILNYKLTLKGVKMAVN
jgi:hypothetical protein